MSNRDRDSDPDSDDAGFVGVGDGTYRRKGVRRPQFDDDDVEDGVGASDSDEEIDRRARAKKRAQFKSGVGNEEVEGEQLDTPAPDGFEPFHMKEERARGWFDSAGNFNLEDEDVREAWLRDYDEKQAELEDSFVPSDRVDLSRKGIKRYRPESQEPTDEYEDIVNQTKERHILVQYLQKGENVLGALRRLGNPQDGDKKAFAAVTEAADRLLQSGHYDVYQDTIETIERDLNADSRSTIAASSSGSCNQWELSWSNDDTDAEPIHGPYTPQQMDEWKAQGYFSGQAKPCYVRVRGAADPEWTDAAEIDSFVNY